MDFHLFLIGLYYVKQRSQFPRERGITVLLVFPVVAALVVGFGFDLLFFLLDTLLQGHISKEKGILVVPAHIFDFSGQNLFPWIHTEIFFYFCFPLPEGFCFAHKQFSFRQRTQSFITFLIFLITFTF